MLIVLELELEQTNNTYTDHAIDTGNWSKQWLGQHFLLSFCSAKVNP